MATYYVDFVGGDDTATGLSTVAAWKTLPGTRNTADTADESTDWGSGTINGSNKVPAGTVFKLKGGVAHTSANGGRIYVHAASGGYYDDATGGNSTTFELDTAWGTGVSSIDGTGITLGIALIQVELDGVTFDGKVAGGIKVMNSSINGIQFKERAGGPTNDIVVKFLNFVNNNASFTTDAQGAGSGQLTIRRAEGVTIEDCDFDGDNNFTNGLFFGNSGHQVNDATVTRCHAFDHNGTAPENDSGTGFKCQNGVVVFTGCDGYDSIKGYDCGENNGGSQGPFSGTDYRFISCRAWSNTFAGFQANNNDDVSATFYYVNCLSWDNVMYGLNVYTAAYKLYIVHCVFDGNAITDANNDRANARITGGAITDERHIEAHVYNSIFYKPTSQAGANGSTNLVTGYIGDGSTGYDTDISFYFDYNAWVQTGTEIFCSWAHNIPAQDVGNPGVPTSAQLPNKKKQYGVDGPGKASGEWYSVRDEFGASGNGHLNCDANSKGTSATDTTLPPFTDVVNNDYTLTAPYSGLDLKTFAPSWYIAQMDFDFAGVERTVWDIGAFESSGISPPTGVYYVDFAAGDDADDGLTTGTAWETIPGTRNVGDTAFASTDWGAFNTSAKIPAGTEIRLKPGTTHSSTVGGKILIDSSFYDDGTASDRITITLDTAAGAGVAVIDGTGITVTTSLIQVSRDGVVFRGVIAAGITIQDSTLDGVECLGQTLCEFRDLKFAGNCTSYATDSAAQAVGQLHLHSGSAFLVSDCEFDGTGVSFSNGICIGIQSASGVVTDSLIKDCESHSHVGTSNAGAGIKGFNSVVTIDGGSFHDNFQGMYLREQGTADGDAIYQVTNVTVFDNATGIKFFGPIDEGFLGTVELYVVNAVIYDNTAIGIDSQHSVQSTYVAHCVFDGNGNATGGDRCNLKYSPSSSTDEGTMALVCYNSVFHKSAGTAGLYFTHVGDGTAGQDTDLDVDMDYNSFVQGGTELAFRWASGSGGLATVDFAYGAEGPGQPTGNWATDEDCPGVGSGHLGCDPNSLGTGAVDTTVPPFTDQTTRDYTLTTQYPGVDISAKPWYQADIMERDRGGRLRTEWSIGAYESGFIDVTTTGAAEGLNPASSSTTGQAESFGLARFTTTGQLEAHGIAAEITSGQAEAWGIESATTTGQLEAGHGTGGTTTGILEALEEVVESTTGQAEAKRRIAVVAPAIGALEALAAALVDTSGQAEANFRGSALPPTVIDVPIKSHIYDEVGIRSYV